MSSKFIYLLLVFIVLISCSKLFPQPIEDNQLLDGPIEGLTAAQKIQFLNGDVAFNDQVFTKETGLGPLFNATSCGTCHAGDGKGHPFSTLTRFGQTDSTGNQFLAFGGPQLQNRALPGFSPETIPSNATFTKLTPPANTGLGFLELISDADLLALSDPNDSNGDGISGIPNWKQLPGFITPHSTAIAKNGKYIHRFGKKAGAYNLLHQTVNAYNQDMGITSVFVPNDTYSGFEIDPEISNQTVLDVVFYLQTLKAPIRRNTDNLDVIAGKNLFESINCVGCHTPQHTTGYSPVSGLSYRVFSPYTDLLLHDMGDQLNDGYSEGSGAPGEWRTPALWGLGLSKQSQGGSYFLLHDGRATSIEQAILFHGGEAQNSKNAYNQLTTTEKKQLIAFLESL